MTISVNGSTLTFSDATTQTSAAKVITSSVVAWANFNGTGTTPLTINASDNVTSISRASAGNYTINFTTALDTAYYAVAATGSNSNPDGESFAHVLAQTVSSVQVQFSNAADSRVDSGGLTSVIVIKLI